VQPLERRDQIAGNPQHSGNMHGRGERIVRRLPHVHVIVRVNRAFFAFSADAEAEALISKVGDHFVGVGVRRGAGPGLVNVDRELHVVFAFGNFLRGADDCFGALLIEFAELEISLCGGGLEVPERMDHRGRHGLVRDWKILDGASRRCAVKRISGHLHFAHCVAFDTEITHCRNPALPSIQLTRQSSSTEDLAREPLASEIVRGDHTDNGPAPECESASYRRSSSGIRRGAAINDSVFCLRR
jgi:hypothetical protein